MHITLGEDIAVTAEGWVFAANQRDRRSFFAFRIFSAVDKARKVARIKVAEPLYLVHHLDPLAELVANAQCSRLTAGYEHAMAQRKFPKGGYCHDRLQPLRVYQGGKSR